MEIVKESIQTDLHGGLISFSEAARFTAPKNIETRQWCKVHNRPAPRYTLYPRTRCFVKMVKEVAADSSVTAIYELTIAHAHQARFMEAPILLGKSLGPPHGAKLEVPCPC